MQFSFNLVVGLASLMTTVVADTHTSCWCESDASKKDPAGQHSKDLTQLACESYKNNKFFYHGNTPFKDDKMALTLENNNGFDPGAGEKLYWVSKYHEPQCQN